MLKKMIFLMVAAFIFNAAPAYAADGGVEVGEYIQLGTYQGEPIIWRCIDEDENGKLMLSDKILCYKAFDAKHHIGVRVSSQSNGSAFWEESTLRTWLNATETAGNITWVGQNPPSEDNVSRPYDDEDGFLSPTNFSESELSAMKSVGQWQILAWNNVGLSTNGIPFAFGYSYYPDKAYWYEQCGYSNISELYHVEGAMYRLSDTVFLLNEEQLYTLYANFGTAKAEDSDYAASLEGYKQNKYYLRSGIGPNWVATATNDTGYGSAGSSVSNVGVRPAFYLNESTATIISGSGTVDDPYIVDGTESDGITVFSNGEQLDFNVDPLIENDSTLVGMRMIFESLGASVDWDSDTWTATASLDDTTVSLQIDNDVMLVNDEEVALDAPARIINDNTMVPLRAISESLGADVEWIENLNRIVIDKPEPQVFDDNKGKENWQTGKFGDWQPDMSKSGGGWSEYRKSLQEDSE